MNPLKGLLILLIQFYRWFISPLKTALFGPAGRCRYSPSCSAYALEAVRRHGAFRGGWLAVCRLCRCHPWADCGPDPVPEVLKGSRHLKSSGNTSPAGSAPS